jgi:hypothetical protein
MTTHTHLAGGSWVEVGHAQVKGARQASRGSLDHGLEVLSCSGPALGLDPAVQQMRTVGLCGLMAHAAPVEEHCQNRLS